LTLATNALGNLGERLAAHHLEAKGYRILHRNYRRSFGEVDLIAEKNRVLSFVEVKARRGSAMGLACEAITPVKAERLAQIAETFTAEHAPEAGFKIDLIAIDFAPDGRLLSLNHYENAIGG